MAQADMNDTEFGKLRRLGALVPTDDGGEGVRVSLHYEAKLSDPSRMARRKLLTGAFAQLANSPGSEGLVVDLSTLAVSAQSVEATLPLRDFERIVADLRRKHVRATVLSDKQIV